MANSAILGLTETAPGVASAFAFQNTDVNTRAVQAPFSMMGGLVYSASSADSNLTGVAGTLHAVDISGWTADRNFVLPVAASIETGERVGFYITTGDDTYKASILSGASGDLINGVDHATNYWHKMFITGQMVIFRCINGTTGDWVVEEMNLSLGGPGIPFEDSGTIADGTTHVQFVDLRARYNYAFHFIESNKNTAAEIVDLTCQLRATSGPTWRTASYEWRYVQRDTASTALSEGLSTSHAEIDIFSNIGITAGDYGPQGWVYLIDPGGTANYTTVKYNLFGYDGSADLGWTMGAGIYQGALEAHDGIRFNINGGAWDWETGRILAYGIPQ